MTGILKILLDGVFVRTDNLRNNPLIADLVYNNNLMYAGIENDKQNIGSDFMHIFSDVKKATVAANAK